MNWAKRWHYYPPIILINTHLVGVLGLLSSWKPFFLWITPMSILFSCLVVFSSHKTRTLRFFVLSLSILFLGFLVEVLGVKTGAIFGNYHYGQTLGFSLLSVPVIMGVNWLILIYCTGCLLNKINSPTQVKCIFGASLLVAMDLLIEQVAIRYDFWHWENGIIPIQNFVAWWIVSFLFLNLFYILLKDNKNRLSFLYLTMQFIFFGALVLSN